MVRADRIKPREIFATASVDFQTQPELSLGKTNTKVREWEKKKRDEENAARPYAREEALEVLAATGPTRIIPWDAH
jgi:hypothetical protein